MSTYYKDPVTKEVIFRVAAPRLTFEEDADGSIVEVDLTGLPAIKPGGTTTAKASRFEGTATDDQGSPDAVFRVNRTHTNGASAHSFRDQTIFSSNTAERAMASFDAQPSTSSALIVDHMIGFQSRINHIGPGTLRIQYGFGAFNDNTADIDLDYAFYNNNAYNFPVGECFGFYNRPRHFTNTATSYGYVHKPAIGAGTTVTNSAGVRIETADGSGTLTNEFGIYVKNLTYGTNKWPLYIEAQTGITFLGSPVSLANELTPSTDNTRSIGTASLRLANVYSRQVRPGVGAVIWTSGTGTPEGVVTAPVGSMFTRTDGGVGTTLYIKETGAGNTGWTAK